APPPLPQAPRPSSGAHLESRSAGGEPVLNPAAAENDIIVVEDDGLAGRDGGLRLIELDDQSRPVAVMLEAGSGGDGAGVVADLRFAGAPAGFKLRAIDEQVDLAGDKAAGEEA